LPNPIDRLYDEVDRLVQKHPEVISFVEGISEDWVRKAELALSLRFPPSFRWYLLNYGGGTIGGEEINGLLGVDFDDACGPDIVFNTLVERRQFDIPHCLISLVNHEDEMFYLDTSVKDENNENPVVREQAETLGSRDRYADNFARFLLKRIEFHLSALT